jgi:hypothetical protein
MLAEFIGKPSNVFRSIKLKGALKNHLVRMADNGTMKTRTLCGKSYSIENRLRASNVLTGNECQRCQERM